MKDIRGEFDNVFPKNTPVVLFHAHPDDESFLTAGIIQTLVNMNRRCVVVFGAAGRLENQKVTTIRQIEASKACKILGISPIFFLNYCDGKYSGEHPNAFCNQEPEVVSEHLITLLRNSEVKEPIVLISYDKNGGYGNKDHITLHRVGRVMAKKHPHLVDSLFEATINRNEMSAWLTEAQRRLNDSQIPQLFYWSQDYGLPEEEISYCLELTEKQLEIKRKALMKHKTQIKPNEFPMTLGKHDFKTTLGKEYLMRVSNRANKNH